MEQIHTGLREAAMLASSKVIAKLHTVRHQGFANQSGDSSIALLLAITALQLSQPEWFIDKKPSRAHLHQSCGS